MERQDTVGYCKNDCLTISRGCQAALKGKEDELQSLLMAGSGIKDLKKKICKKTCGKKLPKLGKWTDEPFKPRDEEEMETEDLIEKMRAETGMGMKMYKREDLMGMSEGDMRQWQLERHFLQNAQRQKWRTKSFSF